MRLDAPLLSGSSMGPIRRSDNNNNDNSNGKNSGNDALQSLYAVVILFVVAIILYFLCSGPIRRFRFQNRLRRMIDSGYARVWLSPRTTEEGSAIPPLIYEVCTASVQKQEQIDEKPPPFGITLEASSLPSKPRDDADFFQPVKVKPRMYFDLLNAGKQRDVVLSQHELPPVTYDVASAVDLITLPGGDVAFASRQFRLQDSQTGKGQTGYYSYPNYSGSTM